jgi:hypothetical protein
LTDGEVSMGKSDKHKKAAPAPSLTTPPTKKLPHSTPSHLARIDQALAIAQALPAELVRRPSLPVTELLRDARSVAAAAETWRDALVARGLSEHLASDLVARADALSQAQAMWLAERSRGLKATGSTLVLREAELLRSDVLALLALALRRSRDGLARLEALTNGEGIADLLRDLETLAHLVRDAAVALAAINEDAAALGRAIEKAHKAVHSAVSKEAGDVLSSSKDTRDRLAVLVEDGIDEVRAFAAVAFRNDPTQDRRGAFVTVSLRHAR